MLVNVNENLCHNSISLGRRELKRVKSSYIGIFASDLTGPPFRTGFTVKELLLPFHDDDDDRETAAGILLRPTQSLLFLRLFKALGSGYYT